MDRAGPQGEEEKTLDSSVLDEPKFRALVVHLILSKDTEKAIELLSRKFGVRPPRLSIGIMKGKKRALAVYSVEANAISFADQDQFFDPFVVLHEMYHCIRSRSGSHRGTEKNADRFAIEYIQEYNRAARAISLSQSHPKVD